MNCISGYVVIFVNLLSRLNSNNTELHRHGLKIVKLSPNGFNAHTSYFILAMFTGEMTYSKQYMQFLF